MGDNDHNEPYWPFAGDGRPLDDRVAPLDAMNRESSGQDGGSDGRDGRDTPDERPPAPDPASGSAETGSSAQSPYTDGSPYSAGSPYGPDYPYDTDASHDASYGPHPWSDSPPAFPAPPPPPPYAQRAPSGPYAPPYGPHSVAEPYPPPPPPPPEAYPGPIPEPGGYYYEPPSPGSSEPVRPRPAPAAPYEAGPGAPYEVDPAANEAQQASEGLGQHEQPADPYGRPREYHLPSEEDQRYAQPQLPHEHAPDPPAPAPRPQMGEQAQPPIQPYCSPSIPYPQPGGTQPGQAPPWRPPPPQSPAPQTAESLSPETLLRGRRRPPSHGWRRAMYRASIGTVHLGESPAEIRRQQLIHRARTPVPGGHHRAAVMSLKGGVGKTTTTVGLGATLASLRGDRVVAVDANPDRGTLSDKVRLETAATVRDLLGERAQIRRYADVRAFTSQALSRLEVLASDRDPAASEAFSEDDYRAVAKVLEHYYSVCITDCGTGLLHSAMSGVLGLANQIVLVSSPSVDGARSASATLDWLGAHEYGDLVRGAVVVLSTVRPKSKSTVDINRLEQHFANRCRAVVRVPYDPHLEEGAEVDLERLRPETREAYLMLAATVGDGFALPGAAGAPG